METTYCTVAEVNTYAAANGEQQWQTLASQSLTGAVNAAAGYSAGATSMTVDGFADDVNRITAGSVFTIGSDSTATEYRVISTRYDSGTVELTFTPGLAESVADNDVITVSGTEATAKQTRCVVQACRDIVAYHKQIWGDGSLWLPNDALLNKANILQALHLSRILEMRDSAESIGALTGGQYSDGSISIEGVTGTGLCVDARNLVDVAMRESADALIKPVRRYAGR